MATLEESIKALLSQFCCANCGEPLVDVIPLNKTSQQISKVPKPLSVFELNPSPFNNLIPTNRWLKKPEEKPKRDYKKLFAREYQTKEKKINLSESHKHLDLKIPFKEQIIHSKPNSERNSPPYPTERLPARIVEAKIIKKGGSHEFIVLGTTPSNQSSKRTNKFQ